MCKMLMLRLSFIVARSVSPCMIRLSGVGKLSGRCCFVIMCSLCYVLAKMWIAKTLCTTTTTLMACFFSITIIWNHCRSILDRVGIRVSLICCSQVEVNEIFICETQMVMCCGLATSLRRIENRATRLNHISRILLRLTLLNQLRLTLKQFL